MAKRILVVEDEADILRAVRFRLEKEGYEVLSAENGQDALELIRDEKPDLVLLDLCLPTVDGREVCRRVKSHEELGHIPVILFTAGGTAKVGGQAKELGAEGYIIKPFSKKQLLAEITRFIE